MCHPIFIPIFLLLAFSVAEGHDTLTSEDYWNTALPNTPIPKALRDRLSPAAPVSKHGNVEVPTVLDGKPGKADQGNNEDEAYVVRSNYAYEGKDGQGSRREGLSVPLENRYHVKPDQGNNEDEAYVVRSNYAYEGKDGQDTHSVTGESADDTRDTEKDQLITVSHKGKLSLPLATKSDGSLTGSPKLRTVVPITPPGSPLFFREKDFHPGAVARLSFKQRITRGHFLTPAEARSIPFSTGKLREILALLSVHPNSPQAAKMATVLRTCETPTTSAEKLRCCTTLESMADFITSNLANHDVKAVATTVEKGGEATTVSPLQTYTVLSTEPVQMAVPTMVVCHILPYPYTVYHCHVVPHIKPYVAHLVGEDGSTKVEAPVMCHETSTWTAQSPALKHLNLKPGEANVCHFLPLGDLAWLPTKSTDDGKGHLPA